MVQIGAPQQPFRPDALETGLEHPAVDTAAGKVDVDVGNVSDGVQRMQPVAAAADVCEDE